MTIRKFGIIGGGAWGTALANAATANGGVAVMWAREPELVEAVNRTHRNPLFLPDIEINPFVRASGDIAEACNAEAILLSTPAQHIRAICELAAPHVKAGVPLVICAKGIELQTGRLLSEVVAEVLPQAPVGVLSGPTFAHEVARKLPTAVTLAIADSAMGDRLVAGLGSAAFRPYRASDVVGAQIGGAVKNVIAIAAGIVTGRGLGENARAALMTRGLAEMMRLGLALGARADTLMGLSGLGDLVLTCSSATSRNMSLGLALARGETLKAYLAGGRGRTAEGAYTASAVIARASPHGVDMPISAAVDAILNRDADIDQAIEALLRRPFRDESEADKEPRP